MYIVIFSVFFWISRCWCRHSTPHPPSYLAFHWYVPESKRYGGTIRGHGVAPWTCKRYISIFDDTVDTSNQILLAVFQSIQWSI